VRSNLVSALVLLATLAPAGVAGASASGAPGEVAVHVEGKPTVTDNVAVSFRPTAQLPAGGYYYAVIVLKPYRHFTRAAPPPCAVSSDMQKAAYGYARPGHVVRLVLTRTRSRSHDWCRGGSYIGGIYAVPKRPPCESKYPCASEYSEASPCWEIEPGRKVCGVVVRPRAYAYPDGLPAPLEKGTRIIGHFRVTF
jgi:hypothetical protein